MRITLRLKAVLICSFLILIPWLGYRYLWEMERVLRQGQENNLLGTAQAIAMSLHEQPALFASSNFQLQSRDLYAYPLPSAPVVDGQFNDWPALSPQHYGEHFVQYSRYRYNESSFAFSALLGRVNDTLFIQFNVTDSTPIPRQPQRERADRNDHLTIVFTTASGELTRVIIPLLPDDEFAAYRLTGNANNPGNYQPETAIQGQWHTTDTGYQLELSLPVGWIHHQLAFGWHNVTKTHSRDVETIIATASLQDPARMGRLLLPDTGIEQRLAAMTHSQAKLTVVDSHRQILAQVGSLNGGESLWGDVSPPAQNNHIQNLINQFYSWLFPLPNIKQTEAPAEGNKVSGVHITQALTGQPYLRWRQDRNQQDNDVVILSATHPIWVNGDVVGVVIAEETNAGIQALRTQALRGLFSLSSAVIIIGITLLVLFASHLSSRIRRLRDQTDAAVDDQGKVRGVIAIDPSKDEIGDLSRGLGAMVERLDDYHHYLEQMSSRLAHELRTPVAVVRSSLENLAFFETEPANQQYITRAQEGIGRLNTILTLMTEANRIEQSLEHVDKEVFSLNEVLIGCSEGYKLAYPEAEFETHIDATQVDILGSPDHFAQCLDKIVSNGLDFRQDGTPIRIEMTIDGNTAIIAVSNCGAHLPDKMQDQLFNSMISIREKGKSTKPHLGLGLYIARQITAFHAGTIRLENRYRPDGVAAVIELPIQ
uniref:proteobacterial dedicated sortase system histidine kinase n=1 Tax=Thaumasiovibrio occultus TaxID=1891184 RepID=UPI000B3610C9|nr:proteobacterial dedicated sortase system histidine kinase [Thaumasiovibrio occultus]